MRRPCQSSCAGQLARPSAVMLSGPCGDDGPLAMDDDVFLVRPPLHVGDAVARGAEVFQTTQRVQDAASTIEKPIDRARALEVAPGTIAMLHRPIRQARALAIREAMVSGTATSVAADLGISRARLHQVLADDGADDEPGCVVDGRQIVGMNRSAA